ncbi:hypothetical protein ACSCB1_27345 [Streptomyces europaeiscabiei]|uniref:Secreted protein n=1 Tax=Streptomyces europaeiscabiei TaxID=146819 RepID=A0ABU4NFB2_9ACTN|nr:hypothetical protein [Streptomyces europaeiscabiei]MDX2529375.1 hypothetical protein [Streptomyces europaeiscabiei]MDX2761374.1 hypothetical protein [Streptomyces europaeiscabiei]MDX2770279.1 hypothetical protein [Streptomyces europaeiscabiei]MDX3543888.1 hypothetical protein [Streptomyces europaeiscabiei]MDX3553275.1 hypothetical protein [Streptomyces europaeiscabiei]
MRISRSIAPAVVALALVLTLPSESAPHARVETGERHARVVVDDKPDPFGAACHSTVTGSQVIAHCYNPYVAVDRVRLHIECARWWDIDSDSAAVATAPARTVRLTGRCWKEVRSVWFSHQRVES